MKRTSPSKGTSKPNRGSKGLKRSGSIKKGKKALKSKPRDPIKVQEKKELKEQMWKVFEEVWAERGPFSELSGEFIPGPLLSIYVHHCLPKYGNEWCTLIKEGLIVLTFEQHQKCENDPSFFPEVVRRRKLVEQMKPDL